MVLKNYKIIIKEVGIDEDKEGAPFCLYSVQKEITLGELKYLLSTVRATKPE